MMQNTRTLNDVALHRADVHKYQLSNSKCSVTFSNNFASIHIYKYNNKKNLLYGPYEQ